MPYAEDYDTAAAAFDAAAQATGTLLEPAHAIMATGVMVGGQLTEVVTEELDAAGVLLDEVSAELVRLAALCRERAETSRQALAAQHEYDAAYADYGREYGQWRATGERGTAPEPPEPPSRLDGAYRWIDR